MKQIPPHIAKRPQTSYHIAEVTLPEASMFNPSIALFFAGRPDALAAYHHLEEQLLTGCIPTAIDVRKTQISFRSRYRQRAARLAAAGVCFRQQPIAQVICHFIRVIRQLGRNALFPLIRPAILQA